MGSVRGTYPHGDGADAGAQAEQRDSLSPDDMGSVRGTARTHLPYRTGAHSEQRDLESEAPSASSRPRSAPIPLPQARQRAGASLPGVSLLLARVPLLLGLALGVTCVLLASPLLSSSSSPLDTASAHSYSHSHSQAQHLSSCGGPSWRMPRAEAEPGQGGSEASLRGTGFPVGHTERMEASLPLALDAHWALAEEALRGSVEADALALQASHSAASAAAKLLLRHPHSSSSSSSSGDSSSSSSSGDSSSSSRPGDEAPQAASAAPSCNSSADRVDPRALVAALVRCRRSLELHDAIQAQLHASLACCSCAPHTGAAAPQGAAADAAASGATAAGQLNLLGAPHVGANRFGALAPPHAGCRCPWLVSQRGAVLALLQGQCGLTPGQVEARALQRTREAQVGQRCAAGGARHRQGPCGMLEGTPGAVLLRQAGIHVEFEGTRGIMRVEEPWRTGDSDDPGAHAGADADARRTTRDADARRTTRDADARRGAQLRSAWPVWAQGLSLFPAQAADSDLAAQGAGEAADLHSAAQGAAERAPGTGSPGQGSGPQEAAGVARGWGSQEPWTSNQELWNSPVIGRGDPAWPYALHRNSSGLWDWPRPIGDEGPKPDPWQVLPLRTTEPDHAASSAALAAAEQALKGGFEGMGRACRGCVGGADALDVSFMLQYWQQPRTLNETVESYSRCLAGLGPRKAESAKALRGVRAELLVNVDQPGEAQLWLHHWRLLNRREGGLVETPQAEGEGQDGQNSENSEYSENSGSTSAEAAVGFLMVVFQHDIHEARGYNRLASAAEGDTIMVLQDDDLAPEDCDWVPRLLEVFERRPRVGCVGTNTFVKQAGTFSPIWTGIREQDAWDYDLDPVTGRLSAYAQLVDIGPMVFQRCVWTELGGFNEGWNHLGEPLIITDWEFSQRIWLAGYRVVAQHAERPELFKRTPGEHSTMMGGTVSVAKRLMVWGVALALMDELYEETHTPVYKELTRSWRLHVPGVPGL